MAKLIVKNVMDVIEQFAPIELAMDYDNVGLLVGSQNAKVKKILLGLELTDSLLEEAIIKQCDLIIVHHPLIFKPIKTIIAEDITGNKVITLIKEGISLYVAHTNLDMTVGGLNDFIAEKLDIKVDPLDEAKPLPNVRVGQVKPISLIDFCSFIKEKLNLNYLHYCGDDNHLIGKVGLCTGSGMSFYKEALHEEVDVYITGDMKYHDATLAIDCNVPIIDATHYGSEILVSELLYQKLHEVFSDEIQIIVHKSYDNPIKTI